MLKFKHIDILSRKTIKTGLFIYIKLFVLSIPLIIPPGFLLQFNLMGWLARRAYGEGQVKFFSIESLSVGWQVMWRYFTLLIPALAYLFIGAAYISDISGLFMSENFGFFEYVVIASLLSATLLLTILAIGWAIERVGFIRLHSEQHRAERMSRLQVGHVIRNSLNFAKDGWFSLILMTLATSVITEGFVSAYGLPPSTLAKDIQEEIILLFQSWFSMTGGLLLLALVSRYIAVEPSSNSQARNVLDIIKQIKPRLRIVLPVVFLIPLIILLGIYLVIPGFVALIWFFFAVQISVLEEQPGVIAVFKRSKALATGRAKGIAALLLVTMTPYLIFVIIDALSGGVILRSGTLHSAAMNYV